MDNYGYDDFSVITQNLSIDEYQCFLQSLPRTVPSIGFFGDSHLRTVVSPNQLLYATHGVQAHIAYLPGSTMLGFGRRSSSVGHFEKIKLYAEIVRPKALILKFGQVDIDLGFYYKLVVKSEQVCIEDYVNALIDAYIEAVKMIHVPVFILPINLPTLKDKESCVRYTSTIITENINDKDEIHSLENHLYEVMPSYQDRMDMTKLFNNYLHKKTIGQCFFIDISNLYIKNGSVGARFLAGDHHYIVNEEDKIASTYAILRNLKLSKVLNN